MRFQIPTLLSISLLAATQLSASSYSWSISADTTRFDYAETSRAGALLDSETNNFGDITGFTIAIEPVKQGFYLTGSFSRGETDYIGGTQSDPTYGSHRTTTDDTIADYSAGYRWIVMTDNREWEIPFKIGIGYRGWDRNIRNTATVSGIDELYEWGYIDVGTGFHYIAGKITTGIDMSYRNAFNAQMYENWHGYTFNLKNVHGYKVTVPLEYAFDRSWSMFGSYSYEYWNIGASDPVGGYYEPDSETKNEILSLGFKFRF